MITITPKDADGNAITQLSQWDRGITVYLESDYIMDAYPVHFAHNRSGVAYVAEGTYADGILSAVIPDIVLEEPSGVFGYVYLESGDTGQTIAMFTISVMRRAEPSDLIETNTANYITVENAIAEIKELLASAQESASSAETSAEASASSAEASAESAADAESTAEEIETFLNTLGSIVLSLNEDDGGLDVTYYG